MWTRNPFLFVPVGLDPCNDNTSWNEIKMLRAKRKAAKARNTVPKPAPQSDVPKPEKPGSP